MKAQKSDMRQYFSPENWEHQTENGTKLTYTYMKITWIRILSEENSAIMKLLEFLKFRP